MHSMRHIARSFRMVTTLQLCFAARSHTSRGHAVTDEAEESEPLTGHFADAAKARPVNEVASGLVVSAVRRQWGVLHS